MVALRPILPAQGRNDAGMYGLVAFLDPTFFPRFLPRGEMRCVIEAADCGTHAGFRGLMSDELFRQLAKVSRVERHC